MFPTVIIPAMICIQSVSYGIDTFPCTHFQVSVNHSCVCDSTAHPAWKNHSVFLYRPDGGGKFPVVFFCHGITAEKPEQYGGLLRHIVARGYAVVYVPYPSSKAYFLPGCTYRIIWKGFRKSVDVWGDGFDLDSIGFIGQLILPRSLVKTSSSTHFSP